MPGESWAPQISVWKIAPHASGTAAHGHWHPTVRDAIIGKGSTFCRELTGKCGRISLFRGKKCEKHGSFALFRGIPAPFAQETVVPTARTYSRNARTPKHSSPDCRSLRSPLPSKQLHIVGTYHATTFDNSNKSMRLPGSNLYLQGAWRAMQLKTETIN